MSGFRAAQAAQFFWKWLVLAALDGLALPGIRTCTAASVAYLRGWQGSAGRQPADF